MTQAEKPHNAKSDGGGSAESTTDDAALTVYLSLSASKGITQGVSLP